MIIKNAKIREYFGNKGNKGNKGIGGIGKYRE